MRGHDRRRGAVRGCALLLVGLGVVAAGAAVGVVMAVSPPDLGAQPAGAVHGDGEAAIAATEAQAVAGAFLARRAHAVAVLSEHDLTVIVQERNPEPDRFHDPQVRIRNGLVVVDARTALGPMTVTAVGKVALALVTGSDGVPDVAATVRSVDAGRLPLPGFLADAVQRRVESSFTLSGLLGSTPFAPIRGLLECVAVRPDGVALGFHSPIASADPGGCS